MVNALQAKCFAGSLSILLVEGTIAAVYDAIHGNFPFRHKVSYIETNFVIVTKRIITKVQVQSKQ